MAKLEMRICKCGRIHFYEQEKLQKHLEKEKELVLICSRCGTTYHIGADKEPMAFYDENAKTNEYCYNMYCYTQKNEIIKQENFISSEMNKEGKRTIGEIIIDEGVSVPMETGYNADFYMNGFADCNSSFERRKIYTSLEELLSDMDDYDEKRKKVRMWLLLDRLTDEQADCLSNYVIEGLDWSGTKYKKY